MGRTQHGNNNPYGHDSELGWVDWRLTPPQRELLEFVQRCVGLRRTLGVFSRSAHFRGVGIRAPGEGDAIKDVSWLGPEGEELREHDWTDPERRALAMLTSGHDAEGRPDSALPSALLLLNGGDHEVSFRLPVAGAGRGFRVLADSADLTRPGQLVESPLLVAAHGVCLLQAAAAGAERA
jgi:isoamylase